MISSKPVYGQETAGEFLDYFRIADDTPRHLSRCFRQLNYCASPSICPILSGREECDHRRAVLVRS